MIDSGGIKNNTFTIRFCLAPTNSVPSTTRATRFEKLVIRSSGTDQVSLTSSTTTSSPRGPHPIPEPIVEQTFKARFPLRIPEDLRRRLELEAKRKGVSLNHLILRRIA